MFDGCAKRPRASTQPIPTPVMPKITADEVVGDVTLNAVELNVSIRRVALPSRVYVARRMSMTRWRVRGEKRS